MATVEDTFGEFGGLVVADVAAAQPHELRQRRQVLVFAETEDVEVHRREELVHVGGQTGQSQVRGVEVAALGLVRLGDFGQVLLGVADD